MRISTIFLTASFLAACVLCGVARSEVFHLKSGGQVEGEWLNRSENPRRRCIIRTPDGAQIALPESAVEVPRAVSDAERKYLDIRSRFGNTIQEQSAIAEICRKAGLEKQREIHLRHILELDPDHSASRVALGYTRHNGKWTTQKEKMKQLGYFYHDGAYRTKQEIAMVEQRKKINSTRKAWIVKLKKWRGWLNDRRRAEEARDLIIGIKDPYAVEAIEAMMKNERSQEVKLLLIDTLANIKGQAPILLLAKLSLDDKDREVRAVARENLERLKSPVALDYFIRELKSKDNARVNRAAKGLEKFDEQSAVLPLIESLITKHQFKITRGKPGQLGGTFGGAGGGTFSSGGSTKIETKNLYNGSVLDALRKLTGMDHGHDVATWRRSYATGKKLDYINARRDNE